MRNIRLVLLAIVLMFLVASGAEAADPTTAHPLSSVKNAKAPRSKMMAMPLVAPLFIEDASFSSTLVLVNSSALTTYADVAVRDLRGETIAMRRVNFVPYGQSRLNLRDVLKSTASAATTGSILVMQSPDLQGMTIAAQLLLTYSDPSSPNYIDEELEMLSADGSQVLRAVADRSTGSPLVAISSVADMPQHIRVQCVTESGAGVSKSLVLSPGETVITQACAEAVLHGADFAAMSGSMTDGPEAAIGVALTSDAMPGSFAAFALAPHGPKDRLYFSSIPFSDPMMLMSPNTVFAGVPVGSAKWLPEGNYVPQIAIANFGNRAAHVRVGYTSTPDPADGTEPALVPTGGALRDVATLTLAPGTARAITMDGLSGDPEMRNSFMVYSDLGPGDVMAKLVSTGNSRLRQVELLGKDEKDQENGGGHPWSLEDGTDSVLLLFNHTNKPQVYNVGIASGAILWQKLVTVPPMLTESIDFRKLIAQRTKDDTGRTLPPTASNGTASWWSPNPEQGRGRLMQANRRTAMARNFSCGYNFVLCGANYIPNIVIWALGFTSVTFGQVVGNTCTAWAPNACSGDQWGTGGGYNYSWSSYNSGIASISGSSTNSSVNAYGAGGGTTTIMGHVMSAYCQDPGGGPATVQKPTYFGPTGADPLNATGMGCATGAGGAGFTVHYQVLDQSGNAMAVKGMTPQERVYINGVVQGPPYWNAFGTPSTTLSDGKFDDDPIGTCFGPPNPSQMVCKTVTQAFQVVFNNVTYPIQTAVSRTDCNTGIQAVISGNPTAYNKTFQQGTY